MFIDTFKGGFGGCLFLLYPFWTQKSVFSGSTHSKALLYLLKSKNKSVITLDFHMTLETDWQSDKITAYKN